ncbi:hypothetical protein ES703_99240 [subsurface metagenome]
MGLTWVWFIPETWYSTGSSTVMSLTSVVLILLSAAYKVVVFPLPVGPVTSMIPLGLLIRESKSSSWSDKKPISPRPSITDDLSRILMTMLSPKREGKEETLRSISRPSILSMILPSWGSLLSAIFIPAMIFILESIGAWKRFGGGVFSCNTPSILYLILNVFSKGSKWMSLALSFRACRMMRLTSFMMGASSAISSNSSAPSSSCITSNSSPMPATISSTDSSTRP